MGKSARAWGAEMGKSAPEMNALLKKHDYLEGSPGDYSLTEKGKEYGSEEDHHRGVGGYSHYNRNWTTRTWDESIMAALAADMVADHPTINASTEPVREGEQANERVVDPLSMAYGTEKSEVEPERPAWIPVALIGGAVVILVGGVVVATNPRVHRWVGENVTPRARKIWRTLTNRGPIEAAADHDDDAPSDVPQLEQIHDDRTAAIESAAATTSEQPPANS